MSVVLALDDDVRRVVEVTATPAPAEPDLRMPEDSSAELVRADTIPVLGKDLLPGLCIDTDRHHRVSASLAGGDT